MSVVTTQLGVPLVVDVDSTLLRADLFWEGLARLATQRPGRLFVALFALRRGRTAFRTAVAEAGVLDVAGMPMEPATLALVGQARAEGRPVVLASAAHESQLDQLLVRTGADVAFGSTASESVKGDTRLARIRDRYPSFDYVGSRGRDLPLWIAARRAYAVSPAAGTLRLARRHRADLEVIRDRPRRLRATVRLLRPHQWSKNALLLLPALAAHLPPSAAAVFALLGGIASFSAAASAAYVINDIADLPNDRAHATKKRRPLAAGDLSIPFALGAVAVLLTIGVLVASQLPLPFRAVLAGYFALTMAYSMDLKRRAVLDVIALASLYTIRVVAGATLVGVPLSRWFLAFSVFFFFSLALAKRVVELTGQSAGEPARLPGRGYRAVDVPVLTSLGATAVMASALVYCLYITSAEVGELYARPDLLWAGLPILLYWQSRLWLFVGRRALDEDPVVFALEDRVSRLLLLGFLLMVWLAT